VRLRGVRNDGMTSLSDRLRFYLPFGIEHFLLRRQLPLILGLVLTDECNLSCAHCRVSNLGRRPLTYAQAAAMLADFHGRGFRELYIEGGEPFLWRDGAKGLEDIVAVARKTGFFHVHIYTNGTRPLDSSADVLWVSIDGLAADYAAVRGDWFEQVVGNVRRSSHRRICVVYVVNAGNIGGIRPFLGFVGKELPAVRGVMFYFHTPYYGRDGLTLDQPSRARAVAEVAACREDGLPVLNSTAGLEAMRTGAWRKKNNMWWIADADGEYQCCRHSDRGICGDCGYSTCAELSAAQDLRPSALRFLMGFW
jgi:MoaA/NifB/PqqE/SkfB family radical SAM enzyme